MAKIISSKNRKAPKQVGNVTVHHGNATQMGGFKHFRHGHELAKPGVDSSGEQVFTTPTGKQFKIKKMSS